MPDPILRAAYNNCTPEGALLPGDDRYVDLTKEGVRGERNPIERIQ